MQNKKGREGRGRKEGQEGGRERATLDMDESEVHFTTESARKGRLLYSSRCVTAVSWKSERRKTINRSVGARGPKAGEGEAE